jgi:hypothetical protein
MSKRLHTFSLTYCYFDLTQFASILWKYIRWALSPFNNTLTLLFSMIYQWRLCFWQLSRSRHDKISLKRCSLSNFDSTNTTSETHFWLTGNDPYFFSVVKKLSNMSEMRFNRHTKKHDTLFIISCDCYYVALPIYRFSHNLNNN